MVTGCWNHLLLPPSSHCTFPLVTLLEPWWWIFGISNFEFRLHYINSSQSLPTPPTPPHSSSHPSPFEQSHTGTNKSSSSQTACNRQTLGWDTSRLECGSGSIHRRNLTRVVEGSCVLLGFCGEKITHFSIFILNQQIKFKLCELFPYVHFRKTSLLCLIY